jgi:hypothetical protein
MPDFEALRKQHRDHPGCDAGLSRSFLFFKTRGRPAEFNGRFCISFFSERWEATSLAKSKSTPKAEIAPELAEAQLASFIAKFTPEIASLAVALRAKMRGRYPTALELVYDNYNALAIGYGPIERTSAAIFSIALYPQWISLFFLQANRGLPDPENRLRGSGNVVRYVVLPSPEALDDAAVLALMQEAVARAEVPFDPKGAHRLIIKSISEKQRSRRPAGSVSTAE